MKSGAMGIGSFILVLMLPAVVSAQKSPIQADVHWCSCMAHSPSCKRLNFLLCTSLTSMQTENRSVSSKQAFHLFLS
jgi:hypothetical protein